MKTELTLMGFQAELAGIEAFALREDIRQFPGLVKHAYRVSVYAGLLSQTSGHSLQVQRFVRTCGLMHEAGTIETLKRSKTHPYKVSEYAKLDPKIMERALQERVYSAPTIGGTIFFAVIGWLIRLLLRIGKLLMGQDFRMGLLSRKFLMRRFCLVLQMSLMFLRLLGLLTRSMSRWIFM